MFSTVNFSLVFNDIVLLLKQISGFHWFLLYWEGKNGCYTYSISFGIVETLKFGEFKQFYSEVTIENLCKNIRAVITRSLDKLLKLFSLLCK
jgi:hypothetical protein